MVCRVVSCRTLEENGAPECNKDSKACGLGLKNGAVAMLRPTFWPWSKINLIVFCFLLSSCSFPLLQFNLHRWQLEPNFTLKAHLNSRFFGNNRSIRHSEYHPLSSISSVMTDNWNPVNLAGASTAKDAQPHSMDFHGQQPQQITLDISNASFNMGSDMNTAR